MDSLSDLQLLSRVVEAGSFAAAAQRLDLNPSSVSKRISRMEHRLGVRLFNRTTRSLALTEAGRALHRRGLDILESLNNLEAQVQDLAVTPMGRLRVACSDAFASLVVVPLLKTFHDRYPQVEVMLLQGDGPLDLLAADADLAIRFEPPRHANFVARRLTEDPWVICASPGYLREAGIPQTPGSLTDHRCLCIHARGQTSSTWEFSSAGQTAYIDVQSTFSGIGMVVKEATLQGLGIARLANFLVRREVADGTLVPLLQSYRQQSARWIYAVYPHREYVPLKVRVFIEAVEAALQDA